MPCSAKDDDCPIKECKGKEEKFRCEWAEIFFEDLKVLEILEGRR